MKNVQELYNQQFTYKTLKLKLDSSNNIIEDKFIKILVEKFKKQNNLKNIFIKRFKVVFEYKFNTSLVILSRNLKENKSVKNNKALKPILINTLYEI